MPPDFSLYRSVTSMEPLLPESGRGLLSELSAEIFRRSGELTQRIPSGHVRREIARVVRGMNSYYSNLIEGHKTLPRDIERALQQEFDPGSEKRRNQELSVAHVRTEIAMRDRLCLEPALDVFSPDFIQWLHREFYSHLPEDAWFTESEAGLQYPLTPGSLRGYVVQVGRHTPPEPTALPAFLERFHQVYADSRIQATDRLISFTAAHHRLAWIHPFGDGNGRVARLQTQAAMIRCGADGEGLWTLSRGLARQKQTYFGKLAGADAARSGDLDGRGNLSDRGLSEFCLFLLQTILDQMTFMVGLVEPFTLAGRIERYLGFVRTDLDEALRGRLSRLLRALLWEGEIPRGRVPELLGVKGTTARDVIRQAVREELVASDSEKRPLRIAFPDKVVEYYFPGLFTDLPVD